MDPFFQYLKSSKRARETLVGPHREFTINSVITLALRQNLGVDKAMSGSGKRVIRKENIHSPEFVGISKDLYKFEDVNDLFSQSKKPKDTDYQNYDSLENLRLKKGYPFKRHPKAIRQTSVEVDLNDVHWRNTELLSQFMTPVGLIKQRNITRLPKNVHNRIARTIKHSRSMLLLPFNSYLKAEHRISLRSLAEDVAQDANMHVDLQTGTINAEPKDPRYEYNRDHYSVSIDQHSLYHQDQEGDDINSPYVQKMIFTQKHKGIPDAELSEISDFDKAVLYTKSKKRKELKRRGVDVDEMIKNRGTRILASSPANAPLDRLDENFFDETPAFRDSFEHMGHAFRNCSEVDVLDFIVAESVHDTEALEELAQASDRMVEADSKIEAKTYQELLNGISNIKKMIPRKQNLANTSDEQAKEHETFYENWNNVQTETEFIRKLELLD